MLAGGRRLRTGRGREGRGGAEAGREREEEAGGGKGAGVEDAGGGWRGRQERRCPSRPFKSPRPLPPAAAGEAVARRCRPDSSPGSSPGPRPGCPAGGAREI